MMIASIPARCSSCPSRRPAGPEPMMATCTRTASMAPGAQKDFDFLRRFGVERTLRPRERNRAQAEQAIQIEGLRRGRRQRVEVLAYRPHVAARDHAAERARGAELLD